MIISLIVAIAENNVIGKDNDLIWYLPADLKFFKQKTTGHHIIMGRKTFESIGGGRPLPNRTSIIITRQQDYIAEGCLVAHSPEEAVAMVNDDDEVFVIGGREIYKQSLDIVDRMYITHVHETFEGDTFFPEIDYSKWILHAEELHQPCEKNKYSFTFAEYRRRI